MEVLQQSPDAWAYRDKVAHKLKAFRKLCAEFGQI